LASISSAILCDFAQVRNGLLFVCSGALTRLFVPELPQRLPVMLAIVVELPYQEVELVHELMIAVKEVDTAEQLSRMTAGFQTGATRIEPGESLYLPLAAAFAGDTIVKSYGAHDVQIAVDGGATSQLTFYVSRITEDERPPA
jgi:hypothetical protein